MEMSLAPNAIQLFEEEGKKKGLFRHGLSPAVLKGGKARRQEGGRRARKPPFLYL